MTDQEMKNQPPESPTNTCLSKRGDDNEERPVVFNVSDLDPGSELAIFVAEARKRPRIIDESYTK